MEKVQDGITFYPEKAGVYVSTAPIVPIIDGLYVINANDIYWGKFDKFNDKDIETTGQFIKWIKSNQGIVGPSNNNSDYYVVTSSENISYPVDKELDKSYTIGLKLYENTSEKTISSIEILNKPDEVKEITKDTHLTNITVIITKNKLIDNKAIFLKVSDTDNNIVIVKIPINIYETSETGQPIVQQSGKITVSGSGNVYNDISTLNFKSGFDIEKENDNTTNINVSTAAFVTTNGNLNIKGLKTFVDGIKVREGTNDYVVLAGGNTKKLSDISGSGNGGINVTYPGTNPPLDKCDILLFNRDDFKLEQDHNTILVSLIKNSTTPTTPTTTTTGGINAIDLYKWDIILEFETNESGVISNIKNKDYLSFRITKNGSLLKDITESFDSNKITKPSNSIEYIDGTYPTSNEIHTYYGIRTVCDENCYKSFFRNLKTKFPAQYNKIFNNIFNNSDEIYLSIVKTGTKTTLNALDVSTITSDVRDLAEDLLTRYNEEQSNNELNCRIYGQPTGTYSGNFGFIWEHNNIVGGLSRPSITNPNVYRYNLSTEGTENITYEQNSSSRYYTSEIEKKKNTDYGTSTLSKYYIYPVISEDMKKEYELVIGTLFSLWYECNGKHIPFNISEFKIEVPDNNSYWDHVETDGTMSSYTPLNFLRLISDKHPKQQGEETETKTVYMYNNPTTIEVSKRKYNVIKILTDIFCKMLIKPYSDNNIKTLIKNDSRKLGQDYSDKNFRTMLNHVINTAGMNIDILQIKFLKMLMGRYVEKINGKYYINISVLEDYVIHRYINLLQSFCGRDHIDIRQTQIREPNNNNYTFEVINDITILEDTESDIIKYFDNEDYNIIINYEKGEYDLTKLTGRLLITFPDSKLKYNKYFNINNANDLGTIKFYVGDSLLIPNMWYDIAAGFDENRIYYTDSDSKAGYKNEEGLVYNNDGKYNSLMHKMYHYFGLENEIERNIIQRMVMISNGFDPVKYSRKLKEGYLINIVEEINDLINTINDAHNSKNIIGEKYKAIKNEYEGYYNDNTSYFSYIFEGITYTMPNDELSNININREYLDNPTDPNDTVNIRRLSIAMAKVESESYKLMYNRNVYEDVPENYNDTYYYENGEVRWGYPMSYPGESVEVMYADLIYRLYQKNGLFDNNAHSNPNRNTAKTDDITIINSNYIKGSILLTWNEINN